MNRLLEHNFIYYTPDQFGNTLATIDDVKAEYEQSSLLHTHILSGNALYKKNYNFKNCFIK